MDKSQDTRITIIASNCEVVGDLSFTGDLIVSGRVRGNLIAESGAKANLELNPTGVVEGEIRVPRAVIYGHVHGDLFSDGHLVLADSAQIKGNLYYNLIEVVKGAQVEGSLVYAKTGSSSPAQIQHQPDAEVVESDD